MNDSGKISSVHGVLHQYHPGGLIEVAPVAGTAGTGPAAGMSYYPGHFPSSTQVPRTMRLDEYQSTQGPRPLSVQTDSHGWGPGSGESRVRPVEKEGGLGIGQQSSFETQPPQVNGSSLMSPSRLNRSKTVSGHKRNAFGDIKQSTTEETVAPLAPVANGGSRHRSRSIGSTGHESRIAALSIQLRSRLSHAAAKVERRRHSRDSQSKSPLQSVQETVATTQASNGSKKPNDSPEGTTISAPDPPGSYTLQHPNSTAKSPELLSTNSSSNIAPQASNKKLFPVPKLAPPVDIVSNGENGRRRRPNPNEWIQPQRRNLPSYHRRYHSQQEFGNPKPYSDYPGTPPLRPPTYSTAAHSNGASDFQSNSQNSSMEQDAIETLLFMSSPANSDFRPNVRQRQDAISKSIDSSMGSNSSVAGSSQPFGFNFQIPVLNSQSRFNGLEAQAGDEIDRMLDQMDDSDSEDERRFVPSHSRSRTLH